MKLEKYTFGKTPAAIYLADYLNVLSEKENTKIMIKKIGHILSSQREVLKQLEKSNIEGILTAHNLSNIVNSMRKNAHFDIGHTLLSNLLTNIVVGEMKILLRKVTQIRHIERQQIIAVNQKKSDYGDVINRKGYKVATIDEDKVIVYKFNVDKVNETINASTLEEKQKAKFKRKNIQIKW